MTHVGIDLGQFIADPYTSGIQRVLQYLAREWPSDEIPADFVIPHGAEFLLANPAQAARVLDAAFAAEDSHQVRHVVASHVDQLADECTRVTQSGLLSIYSSWLLPEVSYHPEVLQRLALFNQAMPCSMIGYDTLPMTEPANYRFTPGTAARVSEYFRLLATVDSVVCISEYSRDALLHRLRRNPAARTLVAHPGGDHIPVNQPHTSASPSGDVTFLRVGTMEARKQPIEILRAFQDARVKGAQARLHFIGGASASDPATNSQIRRAIANDPAIIWTEGASDAEVTTALQEADYFLSFGIEGYGIPVLEAIRLGTPVLYGGIQPAADLMQGRGSTRMPDTSHDSLVSMFEEYSAPDAAGALDELLQPEAVPRWQDFTGTVARASVG